MLVPRPYQRASVDAIYSYFGTKSGNPLLVVPTGGGKSLIIAMFVKEVLTAWPDQKILCVTHVKELIEQNYMELNRLWPEAPAGIHSAGLKRRDTWSKIIFAGIQSVWKKARALQWVDLVLVDEAHLIPRDADTMYGRLISDLRSVNPRMKVIGLTATPYRLDSGLLTDGKNALFTDIAYDVSWRELLENNWLVPLRNKATAVQLDVSGVGMRAGDYIAADLELAVNVPGITNEIVKEVVERGASRRAWLLFCSGVSHATQVAEALRARGVTAASVFGETPSDERAAIIAAFRAGEIRALTLMGIGTTGFNVPHVDLIAMLRPTASTGLYVQMAGRGARTAPGKVDCLVLDYAGNVERHGPVDAVEVKSKKKSPGEAPPTKTCPECDEIVAIAQRDCPACGHPFPPPAPPEQKLEPKASVANVLGFEVGPPQGADVVSFEYRKHFKKGDAGAPPTLRADYVTGLTTYSEWVCLQHATGARCDAVRWWFARGGDDPAPWTIDEALARQGELRQPLRVYVKPDGRWTRVTRVDLGDRLDPKDVPVYLPPLPPAVEEPEDVCPF